MYEEGPLRVSMCEEVYVPWVSSPEGPDGTKALSNHTDEMTTFV